jgi:hypothetical protein
MPWTAPGSNKEPSDAHWMSANPVADCGGVADILRAPAMPESTWPQLCSFLESEASFGLRADPHEDGETRYAPVGQLLVPKRDRGADGRRLVALGVDQAAASVSGVVGAFKDRDRALHEMQAAGVFEFQPKQREFGLGARRIPAYRLTYRSTNDLR